MGDFVLTRILFLVMLFPANGSFRSQLFKDIPVFIYHSKNDLNCPYDLTEQLVKKLKTAGAIVEFVTTEKAVMG
jgi:predicted esterase